MPKRFIIFLNAISAAILWIFLGLLIDVCIVNLMLEYPDIVHSWLSRDTVFYLVIMLPILLSCIIGIYLEFKKSSNKVVLFFQGSVAKKIFLIMAIFLLGLLWINSDELLYGRYKRWADNMVAIVAKNAPGNNDEVVVTVTNQLGIDYLLIASGGGSVSKEYILKLGLTDEKLADNLSRYSRYQDSDMIYIYVVRKNKVVAISSFPSGLNMLGPPRLIRTKEKIKFYIKRQKYKDNFGKVFTLLVIHKVG